MEIRIPDRWSSMRIIRNRPLYLSTKFARHVPRIQPRGETHHGRSNEKESDWY
jgi:hypothetical protein